METYRLGKVIRHSVSSVSGIRLEYSLFRSARRIGGRYSYSIALHQTVCGESEDVYAGDVARTAAGGRKIFRLLTEGEVTACTFFEILEEIL